MKWLECAVCSRPFFKTWSWTSRLFCCEPCRQAREHQYVEKAKQRARVFVAGCCLECGTSFVVVGRGAYRYCTEACASRAARRRAKQRRDKRIRNGVRRDYISLPAVARRDRWVCHICGRRVTRKNWSLDHLIPLSRDGLHVWENVALAHHLCNSKRGADGEAQLLLVGRPAA